jgi:hypothetical protein
MAIRGSDAGDGGGKKRTPSRSTMPQARSSLSDAGVCLAAEDLADAERDAGVRALVIAACRVDAKGGCGQGSRGRPTS